LFAALNVLNGTIIGQCQPRHRHQEFVRFLNRVDSAIDPALAVHVILDNYRTHKHPEVKKWFAAHPRYHPHFTPTSSSWLNQIERWFAGITSKRIRRGTFRSVRELIQVIDSYIRENNKEPKSFVWTANATSILRKLKKYKEILETPH
jgi:transposase